MCSPGYRIIVFVYVFACVYAHARLGRPTSSLTDPWRGMWFSRIHVWILGWSVPNALSLADSSLTSALSVENDCWRERGHASQITVNTAHTSMDSYKLTEPINRKCGSEVDMWRNFLCVCSWSLKHGNPEAIKELHSIGQRMHLVHSNSVFVCD